MRNSIRQSEHWWTETLATRQKIRQKSRILSRRQDQQNYKTIKIILSSPEPRDLVLENG